MAKEISESIGVFCQHYPKVVAIVTAQAQGKDNAMAAAWHTALSRNPPIYGVAISTRRFTYQMIIDSKEFGINFLPFAAAEVVASIGSTSGQQIDKFRHFKIAKDKPAKTKVPILTAAYAAYECRLIDNLDYGDHHFLVGEIVATHRQPEAFTQEETLDFNKASPVLYLGRELYVTTARDAARHLEREVYGK